VNKTRESKTIPSLQAEKQLTVVFAW